jgi:signal transduction histidine kinase
VETNAEQLNRLRVLVDAGFDPDTLGPAGVRERVLPVGGRLQVETEPGRGTSLVAEVP